MYLGLHRNHQLCGVTVYGAIKAIRCSILHDRTEYLLHHTTKDHHSFNPLHTILLLHVYLGLPRYHQLCGVTVYVSIEAIRGSIPYGRTQYPRRTTKGHIVGLSLRSLIVTTVLVNNRLVNQLSGVTVYGSIEAIRGSIPYGHTQYPRRTTKGHIVFGP